MKRHEFTNQFKMPEIQALKGFSKSVHSVAECIADYLPNPFPSYNKIMEDKNIGSKSTIANAINFLKKYNLISIEKFNGNRQRYVLKVLNEEQIKQAVQLSNNTSSISDKKQSSTVQCTISNNTDSTVFESTVGVPQTVPQTVPQNIILSPASQVQPKSTVQFDSSTLSEIAVQFDKKNLQNSESTVLSLKVQPVYFQKYSECTVSNNISKKLISNNDCPVPISNLASSFIKHYGTPRENANSTVQCTATENYNGTVDSTVQFDSSTPSNTPNGKVESTVESTVCEMAVQCTTSNNTDSTVCSTLSDNKKRFYENGAPIPKRIPLPNETPQMTAYYNAQYDKNITPTKSKTTDLSSHSEKQEDIAIKSTESEQKEVAYASTSCNELKALLSDMMLEIKALNAEVKNATNEIQKLNTEISELKEEVKKIDEVAHNLGKQLIVNKNHSQHNFDTVYKENANTKAIITSISDLVTRRLSGAIMQGHASNYVKQPFDNINPKTGKPNYTTARSPAFEDYRRSMSYEEYKQFRDDCLLNPEKIEALQKAGKIPRIGL